MWNAATIVTGTGDFNGLPDGFTAANGLAEQVPLLIQPSPEQSQFGFSEQLGSPSVLPICLARLGWSNW